MSQPIITWKGRRAEYAKKSAVMIYRSMTLKGCTIPNFKLNGIILHVVASYNL